MTRTNDSELTLVWNLLKETYQAANRCTNRSEAQRLIAQAEMLRKEYRTLTSSYYFS